MHWPSVTCAHHVRLALLCRAPCVPPFVLSRMGALAPFLRDARLLSCAQIGILAAFFVTRAARPVRAAWSYAWRAAFVAR